MATSTSVDPIDALIPPPRRWWVRLAAALAILGIVTTAAMLWGFGYLYPMPDCCGSGSSGLVMTPTGDGRSVTVTSYFVNSSGRRLTIESATADLPGADVLSIGLIGADDSTFQPTGIEPLPAAISGHESRQLVITFVPNSCVDDDQPWGTVSTRLNVANGSLPSWGRTYQLPDPIFDPTRSKVNVWPTDDTEMTLPTTPLAAACALLEISQ